MNIISNSVFFGFFLTLIAYYIAWRINKKWKFPITTPLLIATLLVIGFLLLFNIPFDTYNNGAKYLNYFLIPITVCFAVPMYRELDKLKKNIWPILISIIIGCMASVMSVIVFTYIFGLQDIVAKSLAAISVSTPIAIGITEQLGGIVALTVFSVVLTGILGSAVGDIICRAMGITSPIARGLAIGNSSHAAGTVKAMEMGKVEGAMSSLSIVLSGLSTVIIAPIAIKIFFG